LFGGTPDAPMAPLIWSSTSQTFDRLLHDLKVESASRATPARSLF
jgi:hypothetical protein